MASKDAAWFCPHTRLGPNTIARLLADILLMGCAWTWNRTDKIVYFMIVQDFPFVHPSSCPFIYAFIPLFANPSIYPVSLIHSSSYQFIQSFIHPFITSFRNIIIYLRTSKFWLGMWRWRILQISINFSLRSDIAENTHMYKLIIIIGRRTQLKTARYTYVERYNCSD